MFNRFLCSLIIFLFPAFAFSQSSKILVQQTADQLYLNHRVVSGENYYSVGRLFNVAPRDLASYNNLSMNNGLKIGQMLKIPLGRENFTQTIERNAAEVLVPVYHKVKGGETLFRIGLNHNDVPLRRLKEWNNLPSDNVNKDAFLIVGFLRVNKTESPLARNATNLDPTEDEVAVNEEPIRTAEPPAAKAPEQAQTPKQEAATQPVAVQRKDGPTPPRVQVKPVSASGDGFFKTEFGPYNSGDQPKVLTGQVSVFRSTSGWQDSKYYCFSNDATPGSVVRVGLPGSDMSIFAKVLDAIPDIPQNGGVQLVLSNAGAEALGVKGDNFEGTIQYF